jgi:hypothetical protein
MIDEREEADRERVPRGLAAGRDQEIEEHQRFELARRRAALPSASVIVPCTTAESMSSPGAVRFSAISHVPYSNMAALRRLHPRVDLAEVAPRVVERGVRPGEEAMAILLRDAEQAGDRLQRKLGGDVEQEVACAAGDRGVDDGGGPGAELLLQRRERARRHYAGCEAAELLMARVVHHVQQHPGCEAGGQVLDERPAAVAGPAALGRVGVGIDAATTSACRLTTQKPRRRACGRSG